MQWKRIKCPFNAHLKTCLSNASSCPTNHIKNPCAPFLSLRSLAIFSGYCKWKSKRSPRALKHSRIALWVSEWVVCRVHCSNASLCLSWLWLYVWYLTDFLSSFSKTEFHLFRLFRFGLSSGLSLSVILAVALCHSIFIWVHIY